MTSITVHANTVEWNLRKTLRNLELLSIRRSITIWSDSVEVSAYKGQTLECRILVPGGVGISSNGLAAVGDSFLEDKIIHVNLIYSLLVYLHRSQLQVSNKK